MPMEAETAAAKHDIIVTPDRVQMPAKDNEAG